MERGSNQSADVRLASIESVLREHPMVADCAVLELGLPEGARRVAYVVPSRPLDPAQLSEKLLEVALPSAGDAPGRLDAVVAVSGLPARPDGELDAAALRALPLFTEGLAQRAEEQLRAQPGVEHVAVFVAPRKLAPRRLHLDDVVPALARAVDADAGDANLEAVVAMRPQVTRPPALVREPAVWGEGRPWTLPATLERAAAEQLEPRILHLGDDGSEQAQTFAQLLHEARSILAGLRARGLEPGSYVLFQLTQSRDIIPAFWGCLLGGFIPVVAAVPPTYAAATADRDKLGHVWRLLDAPLIVASAALYASVLELRSELPLREEGVANIDSLRAWAPDAAHHPARPDDVAFISLSSGSTGVPKCIQLTHRNILSRGRGTTALCSQLPSDVILNWLPFDHIGSISDWHLRCVDLQCHMIYCSKERVLGQPLDWLRLIHRYRITHSWAPNFAYALINAALGGAGTETWDLSSMKGLLTAGEAVSGATVEEFLTRLAPHGLARTAVRAAFGMAELGSGITYFQPIEAEPVRVRTVDRASLTSGLIDVPKSHPRSISFTSLGPLIAGMSMRIVDDELRVLPEGTIGRLHVQGEALSPGYLRNDEANKVFLPDGWFETGDQGFLHEGQLYLTGRSKDCIIINGANYFPAEIEKAIEEVPGVEVSYTGAYTVRPKDSPRECLAVFFSPERDDEARLPALLRAMQERVAQKVGVKPDYFIPLPKHEVPKTAIGKIQRKQLAARFDDGEFDALTRRVDLLLGNERTLPDWFAEPVFRPRALSSGQARQPAAVSVILADTHGLAERLAARTALAHAVVIEQGATRQRLGERRLSANLRDRDALVALLAELCGGSALLEVIDLRAYGRAPSALEPSALEADASELTKALLDLLGVLSKLHEPDRRVRLSVVGSHAQPVIAGEQLCPVQALVPALLGSAARGADWLEVKHIDLAPNPAAIEQAAEQLGGELGAAARELEVAYRNGTRHVLRLGEVALIERPEASRLRPEGVYLITGGLGGIGIEIARRLLTGLSARVLLVGRTPIADANPKGERAEKRAAQLRELRALGAVEYVALDVADGEALERAVSAAEARWGSGLSGVFHLAGVAQERSTFEESWEGLRAVLAPKLLGALAIQRVLAPRSEAFVVHFSSLESPFPSSLTGAYAAANRALEAWSRHEREVIGRTSYAIAWSAWVGLGMSGQGDFDAVLRSRGLSGLTALQGLNSLLTALAQPACPLLVGIRREVPVMQALLEAAPETVATLSGCYTQKADAPPLADGLQVVDLAGRSVSVELERLASFPLTAQGAVDREALRARITTGGRVHVAPRTDVERKLAQIFQEVLGLESVSVIDSFFDLGGTSLMSLRLFGQLEAAFGRKLPASTLYEAPSIEQLAPLFSAEAPSEPQDCMIVLARGAKNGESKHLFLIHDADGETVLYGTLAKLMEDEFTVCALRPQAEGELPIVHTRISDIAAHYVARIRKEQPAGPYYLGGLCAGGVLAFEIGCQLQALGEEVGLVALFDAATPHCARRSITEARGDRLRTVLGRRDLPVWDKLRIVGTKAINALVYEATQRRQELVDYTRFLLLRRFLDRKAGLQAFVTGLPPRLVYHFARRDYQPGRFRGALSLFRATQSLVHDVPGVDDTPAVEMYADPLLGWDAFATLGVETTDVAGGHSSMLQEPQVRELARLVRERIGASRTGDAASEPLRAAG